MQGAMLHRTGDTSVDAEVDDGGNKGDRKTLAMGGLGTRFSPESRDASLNLQLIAQP